MKAFIRTLTIKERKGYVFSICYTCFIFVHVLLVKLMAFQLKMSYLTMICESGSIISFICIYRILMTLKKFRKESFQDGNAIIVGGFYSFCSFSSLLGSLYWVSLTDYFIIERLYPFLFLLSEYFMSDREMSKNEITCFAFTLIAFLMIYLPMTENSKNPGSFFALFSIITKVIATRYWKNTYGIRTDLLLLSVGCLCVIGGGVLMITMNIQMEKINVGGWLLLILNAFATYYTRIFLLKLLKIVTNFDKIVVFNLVCIICSLIVDLFYLKEEFDFYYLGIILIVANSLFFTHSVIRTSQANKFYHSLEEKN